MQIILLPGLVVAQSGATFEGLGFLPNSNFSEATAVSADGSVVAGTGRENGEPIAFRWTADTGMVSLGGLPPAPLGSPWSEAFGISADGDVIVGWSRGEVRANAWGYRAFRWSASGGMSALPFLPDLDGTYNDEAAAHGVSADGATIVGMSDFWDGEDDGYQAAVWSGGNPVGLGDLEGGFYQSRALAIAAEAPVVVGHGRGESFQQAFRYAGGSMNWLGSLSGGELMSEAHGVSPDGSVVVGWAVSAVATEPFRWTASTGMVSLGHLPGSNAYGVAYGASEGGVTIVGMTQPAGGQSIAFIWTAATGMVALDEYLTDRGVDLTGWRLERATAITPDGTVIVGYGLNPQGQGEAFRVVLDAQHHWVNAAGGAWDDAANWSPATVPQAGEVVIFDLPGAYTVVGSAPKDGATVRSVDRLIAAEGATVDFADVGFAVTSPDQARPSLTVIGNSTAKLVAGSATMTFASIGAEPAVAGEVARLQVFNAGTFLDGAASLLVGQEGAGEVFVANDGRFRTFSARLGVNAPGDVVVGNGGGVEILDELELGRGAAGRLIVEEGGVAAATNVVVGKFLTQNTSSVEVVGTRPSGGQASQLRVAQELRLGDLGDGSLTVSDGGLVTAGQVLLANVSSLHVTGHAIASSALEAGSLQIGVSSAAAGGANVAAVVDEGGAIRAGSLTLGGLAGNRGLLIVAGRHAASLVRSSVIVGSGGSGACFVGLGGHGYLELFEEATFLAESASLGFATGSEGTMVINDGCIAGIRAVVTIGDEGTGRVVLDDGVLDALAFAFPGTPVVDSPFDVVVTPTGSIVGQGSVFGTVSNQGLIGPGIVADVKRDDAFVGKGEVPQAGGTLEIQGKLVQGPDGIIELALAGTDTARQSRLVVRPHDEIAELDGTLVLDGVLRLNFTDGYAPRAGDAFAVVAATSVSGAFRAVEVAGLAPGWQFETEIRDGSVVIESLNDGTGDGGGPTDDLAGRLVAYPNPFQGETTVAFELPVAAEVTLSLYDLRGRRVAAPRRTMGAGGRNILTVDGRDLPDGVYFIRVEAAGRPTRTQRVMLVR